MPTTVEQVDTDALQARIAETVEQIYRDGDFRLVGHTHTLGGAVSRDEANLLRDTVAQCGARRTLETGMGSGISGLHICWGLLRNGGGHHTAIDPYQKGPDWKGLALDLRDHVGLTDMFEWVCEKSDLALPKMVAEGVQIDLAFIDGNHRFEGALLDFYYIDQLLAVGGVCIFDDADWPSVRRAVHFAERHRQYKRIGGSKVDLGPLTRVWGWKMRLARRARFRRSGWPAAEANHPPPFETVVLQKTGPDKRDWRFWAPLD